MTPTASFVRFYIPTSSPGSVSGTSKTMTAKDKNISSASVSYPRFREQTHLEPFLSFLDATRMRLAPGQEVEVYITHYDNPANDYDMTPRRLRQRRGFGRRDLQPYTPEDIQDWTVDQIRNELGKLGQSCNATPDSAIASFKNSLLDFIDKNHPTADELEAFFMERGQFLCKYIITDQNAWITPFNKKLHANVYMKEGYDYAMAQDTTYQPVDLRNMAYEILDGDNHF